MMNLLLILTVFRIFIPYFQLWKDIVSGNAIEDPSLLSKVLLLTFAVSTEFVITFF